MFFCVILQPKVLHARGGKSYELPSNPIKFEFKRWYSSGHGKFIISFPLFEGIPKSVIATGSTLDYQKLDTMLNIVSVEIKPFKRLSFEVEYGDNSFSGGTGIDHDWIHAPNYIIIIGENVYYRPDHEDFCQSKSTLSGSTKLLTANAYIRTYSSPVSSFFTDDILFYQSLDFFVGFGWYDDKIRARNGVQTISHSGVTTTPLGPFDGLNSTYHFHWEGMKFGLRETMQFPNRLLVEAKFAYSPLMQCTGKGYWNLRAGCDYPSCFRSEYPSFIQTATGHLIEASLSLMYNPYKTITAELGYMGSFYSSRKGTDTTFFSDGSVGKCDLDRITISRKGFFIDLSARFF